MKTAVAVLVLLVASGRDLAATTRPLLRDSLDQSVDRGIAGLYSVPLRMTCSMAAQNRSSSSSVV